jgi:hypothetical protein
MWVSVRSFHGTLVDQSAPVLMHSMALSRRRDSLLASAPSALPIVLRPILKCSAFVCRGALAAPNHIGTWGYDLTVVDERMSVLNCVGAKSVPAGIDLVSPVKGRVTWSVDEVPDALYSDQWGESQAGNTMAIETEAGDTVEVGHFLRGSLAYKVGDCVSVGAFLGKLGCSGDAWSPHVHIHARRRAAPRETVPIVLSDVVVGLNVSGPDPWDIVLDKWSVAEGFFIRVHER